jgi:phospholipid/cholesterol/gamma-HCH transport system substrate-binding protein
MSKLKGHTLSALVKLIIFTMVTLVLTLLLAFTIGNVSFSPRTSYKALFSDATELTGGDDVRIAGVRVGEVTSVKIAHYPASVAGAAYSGGTQALVSFTVDSSYPLTSGTTAQLRFRNLVGQRYLNLQPGPSAAPQLTGNSLITNTAPALDLTTLFNGFQPLFEALSPAAINSLSGEIIETLQGEGGNVDQLLATTASLTNTLADRDTVINEVIDNLNAVLATVQQHDAGLADVVDQLDRLVTGLAGDRTEIASSLGTIDTLAANTASLLSVVRPALPTDLTQLSSLAHNLATTTNGPRGPNTLSEFLSRIPYKLNAIIRTATYGSWFNFWLCNISVEAEPGAVIPLSNTVDRTCSTNFGGG